MNDSQIKSIIEKHGKNVRECITCLQMTSLGNYNNRVYEPEYIGILSRIIKQIMKGQSAKSLRVIKNIFIELLMHGFKASYIIYKMMSDLIDNNSIREDTKRKIIEVGSEVDIRLKMKLKVLYIWKLL